MSKLSKKSAEKPETIAQKNGHGSKFSRAKAVARRGLNTSGDYAAYVNASNEDYVLDNEYPDPRTIFSGVGKAVAIANAQLRAAALFGKSHKGVKFFLTE